MGMTVDVDLDVEDVVDNFEPKEILDELDPEDIVDYVRDMDADVLLGNVDYETMVDYFGPKDLIIAVCSARCNDGLLDKATTKKVMGEIIDDFWNF